MKAFLEPRANDREYVMISRNGKHLYAPHFHYNIEVFIVKSGRHVVTANGKEYVLESGTVALFDCYDIHSYDADLSQGKKDDCVIILPLDYASHYVQEKGDKKLATPLIHNAELCDKLLELIDRGIAPNTADTRLISAYTEVFFALLYPHLQFVERGKNDLSDSLIHQILFYINDHYTAPISLPQIAKDLGYTEAHLSRTFHRYLRTGIPEFINNMRLVSVLKTLRKNPDKKLQDVVKACGFQSMQTYYRVKKNKDSN